MGCIYFINKTCIPVAWASNFSGYTTAWKGQCHQSLSQIKEAINAFKMAKEVAELAQTQVRGSKLKTAKEDELSAVCRKKFISTLY